MRPSCFLLFLFFVTRARLCTSRGGCFYFGRCACPLDGKKISVSLGAFRAVVGEAEVEVVRTQGHAPCLPTSPGAANWKERAAAAVKEPVGLLGQQTSNRPTDKRALQQPPANKQPKTGWM
jgi:hypothetical protein